MKTVLFALLLVCSCSLVSYSNASPFIMDCDRTITCFIDPCQFSNCGEWICRPCNCRVQCVP